MAAASPVPQLVLQPLFSLDKTEVNGGHGVGRVGGWDLNGEHWLGKGHRKKLNGETLVFKGHRKKLNGWS